MNNVSLIASALSLLATVAVVGCASDNGSKTEPEDRQTITGQLDTGASPSDGSGGLTTKTVVVSGELHVVAHHLGSKDHVGADDVDAVVAADGSFDLALSRGARYVFELQRGSDSVAFFGWNARGSAEKTTVLGIASTTKGKAAVSLGHVKVVGNGAVPEVSLADSFDESDTTGIDLTATYFADVHGAVITADEALQEASAALEQASAELQQAAEQLKQASDQVASAEQQAQAAAQAAQAAAAAQH
jgi:hypothetical protein